MSRRSIDDTIRTASRLATVTLLFAAAGAAQAQMIAERDTRPVRFFVGGGLTAGGDRLVTAYYRGGRDETIRAGGLLQVHAGVEFRVAQALSLALSAGYHVDTTSSRYGSVWFERVPIEALAHFQVDPKWRLGGGLRFATNAKLDSDGDAPDFDERFRSTLGSVVEIEHLFTPRYGLKLRGVFERYKSRNGLPTVSGNHVGLMFNFYF